MSIQSMVEHRRILSVIDCACNALTDSIAVSGNDPDTNLAFVRKLRIDSGLMCGKCGAMVGMSERHKTECPILIDSLENFDGDRRFLMDDA